MTEKPLAPEDRAYLREVMGSVAGRRWFAQIVALRPAIGGKSQDERVMSASEALGYERAVHTMATLIDEPSSSPELKPVNIRDD